MDMSDAASIADDPFSFIESAFEAEAQGPLSTEDFIPQQAQQPASAPAEGEQGIVGEGEPALPPHEARIRDWQSKYDRLQSEFDQYRTLSEDSNTIWKVVQNDPALAQRVFSTIEESLSGRGSSTQGNGASPAVAESPPAPKEPARPSDYSDSDALMEPQSASWKYRLELEEYHRQKLQYDLQQGLAQIQQMVAPVRQTYEEQMRERARQEQMALVHQQFIQSGLPEAEAAGVMNWAAAYNITPQDIALLYRHHNQQAQQPPPQPQPLQNGQQRAAEVLRTRNERLAFPTPAATAPRGASEDRGDFFDQLLELEARTNIL